MIQVLDAAVPAAGFGSEPVVTKAVKAKNPAGGVFFRNAMARVAAQDKLAGTAIVAIMTTIFSLGLLGYIFIAWLCAGG